MKNDNSLNIICRYLPMRIRNAVWSLDKEIAEKINEIRIRTERPVALHFSDRACFITSGGAITQNSRADNLLTAGRAEMNEIFNALCRYSLHSSHRELSQGFFTIENGIRVGISGSVAPTEGHIYRNVSGLNFRVSRQLKGCGDTIFNTLLSERLASVLICGGVNTGKTTILRDLCRSCGNAHKVSLIDERNELSAVVSGVPSNDIGIQTDVIEGGSRADGIVSAIRTLSPEIIICDELCTAADTDAVMSGFGCGIRFIATVHAVSYQDLHRRSFLKEILSEGVFDYAVFLAGSSFPGKIREIRRLEKYA